MPHKVDFTTITNVKSVEVHPKGWTSPLFVEYGIGLRYNVPSYFWKVRSTEHTFTIPIERFEFLSSGDYKSHFSKALEGFRKDYMEWKDSGFNTSWMKVYHEEFKMFIL